MRGGFLGAGGETVGREIASRIGVALQRDKDVGQGTGEQFRVKEVVRFLKGPVLRRCNGFGFGGAAFHWVALVVVFVSYDTIRFGCKPFSGQDYCSLGVLVLASRCTWDCAKIRVRRAPLARGQCPRR